VDVPLPPEACDPGGITCAQTGLNLAYFANSFARADGYGVSDGFNGVGPDYYFAQSPLGQGVAPQIFVPLSEPGPPGTSINPIPGSPQYYPGLTQTFGDITYDANNFTLVFTGYFNAQETGNYRVCTAADNRAAFYVGSGAAFPCGDPSAAAGGATPLAESWFANTMLGGVQCNTIDMVQGYWYPLRIVFGNWGAPSDMQSSIVTPSQQVILSGPQLLQNNCL